MLKCRRKVTDADIVVHYLVRDDARTCATAEGKRRRLALAVSKSVGNAVVRNTVKRRFRVLAQDYEHELPDCCDIVVRAKPSAANASFSELNEQVEVLFRAVAKKHQHTVVRV